MFLWIQPLQLSYLLSSPLFYHYFMSSKTDANGILIPQTSVGKEIQVQHGVFFTIPLEPHRTPQN